MVRNVKGFTFVELMISMIILSIVLTIVTGTMVYISKRNASVDESNHGYQIAKEKLIELQSGDQKVATVGSDQPSRNGIDYNRSWLIETDSLPYPVTVTVTWESDGKTDSVVVVGYVNSTVCEEIVGNKPPEPFTLYDIDGVDITNNSPIAIAKNGDVFVCSLFTTDPNELKGDVVNIAFHPDGQHNDQFILNSNNQIYSASGTTNPGIYNLKVKASDCADSTTIRDIVVEITSDVNIEIIGATSGDVDENSAEGTYIASVDATPGADTFYIVGGDSYNLFTIGKTGDITVNNTSRLDFEDGNITNPVELTLKATYGLREGTGKFYVTINNVPEKPYDITANIDTIYLPVKRDTVFAELIGHDHDEGDSSKTLSFGTVSSIYDIGFKDPDDSDMIFHFNGIAFSSTADVNTINNLSHGDIYSATFSATDQKGLRFEKELSFTIGLKSVGGCTCNTNCDALVEVPGGKTITSNGCYFHLGEFASHGAFLISYATVTVNGVQVSHGTSAASLPPLIDGGYYIEITNAGTVTLPID